MSKSYRIKSEAPNHRNQVAREMIVARIGVNSAGRMKNRKDKRQGNPRKQMWDTE